MVDKQFLFIDRDVMNRINRQRGDLSQNDFIGACVDNFLGTARPSRPRPARKVWRGPTPRPESPRRAGGKSSLLFLDQGLLDSIDASRGGLSRADFLSRCIGARLPRPAAKPVTYATRQEFQDFKDFIKRTLKEMAGIVLRPEAARRFRDEDYTYRERETAPPPRPRSEPRYRDEYYRPLRRPAPERAERPRPEPPRPEPPRDIAYDEPPRERPPAGPPRERAYVEPPRERPQAEPPREREHYAAADNPPRPAPREVHQPVPEDRGSVHRVLDNLKTRLQSWLFTQEEPAPAIAAPDGGQYRRNEYDISRREVSRHDVYYHNAPREAVIHGEPSPLIEEEEPESPNLHPWLWGLAILLFGFGDTLLSTMVFSKGGFEANPLMGGLVSMLGGSIIAFVIIKTVIMGVLALISFKVFKKQGWLIPSILIAVGGFLCYSNLMAYINLG